MKRQTRRYPADSIFESEHRAKLEICRALRKAVDEERLSQAQIAIVLRTSRANVSRAIRYPTATQLTYNQLFRYLGRLRPKFRLMILL